MGTVMGGPWPRLRSRKEEPSALSAAAKYTTSDEDTRGTSSAELELCSSPIASLEVSPILKKGLKSRSPSGLKVVVDKPKNLSPKDGEKSKWDRRRLLKVTLLLMVFCIPLLFMARIVRDEMFKVVISIRKLGIPGIFVYAGIGIFMVVCLVPITIVEMTCGYLYGFWIAFAVIIVFKFIGNLVSLKLGRACCLRHIRAVVGKSLLFQVFESSMATEWKMLILFRFGYIPIGLKNYGLSSVEGLTYWRFCMASLCADIPMTTLLALTGSTVKDVHEEISGGGSISFKKITIGCVLLVLTTVLIAVLLWRAWRMTRQHISNSVLNSPCKINMTCHHPFEPARDSAKLVFAKTMDKDPPSCVLEQASPSCELTGIQPATTNVSSHHSKSE